MQNSLCKAFVYRNVAGVIAETELIKIPLHMLTANPVVYAVDSTFAIIPPKGRVFKIQKKSRTIFDQINAVTH